MGTAAAAAAAMVLAAVVGNPFGPQPGLHFTETPQREYDFVVVGGGTAGSLIAAQLARSNPKWEVLLLEAGALRKPPPPLKSSLLLLRARHPLQRHPAAGTRRNAAARAATKNALNGTPY